MIFRQLFEELSCTYTYLIGCEESGDALLIDPVYPAWERDLREINKLGLSLKYTIETHIHADHITSALKLKQETGCKIIYPNRSQCDCPDLRSEEGVPITIGSVCLKPIYTPGHTDDHFSYQLGDKVLTGDALLIDGCGRTDFQNGSVAELYASVNEKLFTLPADTLVYPGHDYNKRHVSSIIQEKERNPRLGQNRNLAEFTTIMNNLDLPYPKFIDHAVPGNQKCGVCPSHLPEDMENYCHQMTDSLQG
jgi:glyoxylase-like metal-dependent hydrolase (beta-lactamase superfamily II)